MSCDHLSVFDFITSNKTDSVQIKVPESYKSHYQELCRYYCISVQEVRNNSSLDATNSALLSLGKNYNYKLSLLLD